MGCIGTTIIGIVGGLLGGWIWTDLLGQNQAGGFLGALLIAILGSALVLLLHPRRQRPARLVRQTAAALAAALAQESLDIGDQLVPGGWPDSSARASRRST